MLNLLQESVTLSNEILQQCRQDNWDSVNQLQTQRHQLINTIANTELPSEPDKLKQCSALAAKLKTLNNEIEILSKQNKEKIYTQIKANNKSKRMNTAYRQ